MGLRHPRGWRVSPARRAFLVDIVAGNAESDARQLSGPHGASLQAASDAIREMARALEGAETIIAAAVRLEANRYQRWQDSGGPDECPHGIADGIACPACDLRTVRSASVWGS